MAQQVAKVRFNRAQNRLEVAVPKGTLPNQIVRLNETLTAHVIPGLTACPHCYSGLELLIKEELADVVSVDLATGNRM
ncbi:MAG TPA: hypothetical protein VFE33_04340 [Thermoanaerobaculia bacterium]|nr:hypothetical protein [Thermoanaerobaculia bacterium]